MKANGRIGILLVLVSTCAAPSLGLETDVRDLLRPENVTGAQIRLNPTGALLGFEAEFDNRDPRLAPLMELIRESEPGGGHRCANAGSVRFRLTDGSVIAVGLLPAHTPGVYDLRLYEGERHLTTLRVDRARLLAALAEMGVPLDDPAFRE